MLTMIVGLSFVNISTMLRIINPVFNRTGERTSKPPLIAMLCCREGVWLKLASRNMPSASGSITKENWL